MKSALLLSPGLLLGVLFSVLSVPAYAAPMKHAPPIKTVNASAEHLRALNQAQAGNIKGAVRALQILASRNIPAFERDRVYLSIGRLDYEIGYFDAAITAYEKVDKTGPSWMESLEETAWAELRAGRPDVTIGKLKTVTSIAFKDETNSEPFFLMGLAQLRVCDFKAVFKTIDLFKSRFLGTTKALEASKLAKDQARLKEIGETVQKLNLVEAETIQRLYVDENGKKRGGSTPSIVKGSDQLSFPATDDDEFWLDEVDGYKVSLKGCLKPLPAKAVASSSKNEVVK
jgi:tetratricopeptide (TPR) repeat protein